LKRLRSDDLTALAVLVVVVLADQLSKDWALSSFQFRPRHVVWTLELVVAHNTGTAFSLLSGRGVGPAIALAAVVVVVVILRTLRTVQGRTAAIASGLVVGGALGNLADRLFRSHGGFLQGAVVDWINFQWWPVFNLADAARCVGAVLLGIVAVFAPVEPPADEVADDEAAPT
jgi:signal peptidase II